jgi:choline dehydrogenase-like flavoprotein
MSDDEQGTHTTGFAERVRANQQKLTAELKSHRYFIVCGSGSCGSVVARRLAEKADVSMLLLEAGGSDDEPAVMNANNWARRRAKTDRIDGEALVWALLAYKRGEPRVGRPSPSQQALPTSRSGVLRQSKWNGPS